MTRFREIFEESKDTKKGFARLSEIERKATKDGIQDEYRVFFAQVLSSNEKTITEQAFSELVAEHESELLKLGFNGFDGNPGRTSAVKHVDMLDQIADHDDNQIEFAKEDDDGHENQDYVMVGNQAHTKMAGR